MLLIRFLTGCDLFGVRCGKKQADQSNESDQHNDIKSFIRTLSIIHSQRTSFTNIYVNNTGESGTAHNTDGADTIYSSDITFRNWEVVNGDDSISLKANSTDILIEDCTFYNGLGVAIGSIGQYKGVYETVERVLVKNITYDNTLHAAYVKTWTGQQVGYPPNGGGGGLGCEWN